MLADGTEYPYEGLYDYTRKDVSSTTGTLVLVVMFPNPDRSLKPGQFARVEASVGPVRPRVVVPQACVSQAQGVNSVWVVRPDSTAMYRRVIPGDTYGSMWCIDEGLIDGELVVTAGQQKLHNGMKVIPEKSDAMEKFFVSRPIFALSLAIVIVLVGLISILNLPIEQYPRHHAARGRGLGHVRRRRCRDGQQRRGDTRGAERHGRKRHALPANHQRQRRFDGHAGDLRHRLRPRPGRHLHPEQRLVGHRTAPLTVTKQGVTTRKTMTGFLLVFSLHSDGRYDAEFLSNYAYINLQNELLKINGVGKVSIMGAGEYAMRIWLKPDVLKYYGIRSRPSPRPSRTREASTPPGSSGPNPRPTAPPILIR